VFFATRAVAADAGGASSALSTLVGAGVLLGLGASALRAQPALSGDSDAAVDELSDDDDSSLRWGVAGFVSCLPLFGFAAWFLPAMGGEVAGSSTEPEDPARAQSAQRYLLWAALYGVAYASRGFDAQDPGTWAVALACAAHVQLERLAFEAERRRTPNPNPKLNTLNTLKRRSSLLDVPEPRAFLDALVETSIAKEREAVAETSRFGSGKGNAENASAKKTWFGGEDPLPVASANPLGMRLPEGGIASTARPRLPEPPELTVRGVGRALGATQIAAARLREAIEEGKLRAAIEDANARESERLRRESLAIGAEISDWDQRFEVRTMTRERLMDIARERGLKGYSKLRRPELLRRVEAALYGSEAKTSARATENRELEDD
jgi:hypothetical protein